MGNMHAWTMTFNLKNRLLLFMLMVVSLILVGSLGYIFIKIYVEHETTSLTDAIYFSVATITTLGHYPQGVELHSEIGKWFTILYLIFGLGIIFGGIQTIIGPWIEMKIKRAVKEWNIPIPRDAHVVICGYNDMAHQIVERLKILNIPYIIVDENPPSNLPHVRGKPMEIETLKEANVMRASSLISLMNDEKNAVTVLTARKINKNLRIISLVNKELAEDIIKKCGADVIVSKSRLIGAMLEHWARGDFTHEFIGKMENMRIGEIKVRKNMDGKMIKDTKFREKYGTIIAVYRGDRLITNPPADFVMREEDILIVMGGEST